MKVRPTRLYGFILGTTLLLAAALPLPGSGKKWAVVATGASKLQDISLADLAKLCKGEKQSWPDGKSFTVVMPDPESPEMRSVVVKLFGVSSTEIKALVNKLNASHTFIRVVENDEEVMRVVGATPGAIGFVDVYAINGSVKVLRVDGRLPFDSGYGLN